MSKHIIAALIAFFLAGQAIAQTCAEAAKWHKPYKGYVMTVSNVTERNVTNQESILYKEGKKYTFVYSVGKKRLGSTWSVFPKDSKYQISNGDTFAWIPSPARVVLAYPQAEQERYDATIFHGPKCKRVVIDFSAMPKEIPI